LILAGIVMTCNSAFGQSTPAFEVVSIRPDPLQLPQPGVPIQSLRDDLICDAGGRFVAKRNNLQRLILKAYNVQGFQIDGMPGWTRSSDAFYDVEATAGQPVSAGECGLLLQSLLTDRFNLVAHRQSKEIPVMALVVGKRGPKMMEAQQGGPGAKINGRPQPIAPDGAPTPAGWTMSQLAQALTLPGLQVRGAPVVDRTGLPGIYQFDLRYNQFPGIAGKLSDLPDMDAAVDEQLGLKLEQRKEPFAIIVVEGIERPTPNLERASPFPQRLTCAKAPRGGCTTTQ
jgi:uncharacterized protein (TIGR03435 family)